MKGGHVSLRIKDVLSLFKKKKIYIYIYTFFFFSPMFSAQFT